MNLIERTIAALSPSWGLRRYRDRKVLETAERAYEAAKSDRFRPDKRSRGSADTVNSRSIEVLRDRARYMDENFDIASGALDVLESKIIGAGIQTHPMARATGGDELAEDFNKRIAELWRQWIERPEVTRECNWSKAQRLLCRAWLRDGESLVTLLDGRVGGLEHMTPIPFSIDLLESDFIPMTGVERVDDEHELAQGIIRDMWGRADRYLIYRAHPGASRIRLLSTMGAGLSLSALRGDTKEWPAGDVLHLKHTKRIRQARGVSILATVFNRLDDLKDYEESERVAARIGAYVALQIHKGLDTDLSSASGSSAPRELDWMPGMIFDQLAPGEKVESIKNERPSNQIEPFRQVTLRAVAAGMRTGYSSIARHYDNSYSAQRQELVENEAHYHLATEEFVSQICRPIYQRFVQMALMSGQIPARMLRRVDRTTIFNAAFRGPGVAYIDPLKEVNSEIKMVRAGFASRRDMILKHGGNPADVEAELTEERAKEADAGLVLESNPVNDKPPTLQLADQDDDEDEDTDDDEENGDEQDGREADPTVLVGRRGRRGRRGPAPDHEWDEDGTRVRFRNPDGTWGPWSTHLGP